jgi:hypothetical protein
MTHSAEWRADSPTPRLTTVKNTAGFLPLRAFRSRNLIAATCGLSISAWQPRFVHAWSSASRPAIRIAPLSPWWQGRPVRGTRFEVAVQTRFLQARVFDAQNLFTVPHAKLVRKLGYLPPDQFALVEQAVREWLGL